MLRYCTFSAIYTTTWCYATARSLQLTQLRDATLTGVGGWVGGGVGGDVNVHWTCTLTWCYATAVPFNLYNYVMLRYCTFSSIYTTTWCYVDKLFSCTCALSSCYVAVGGGCWGCVSKFFIWLKDIYPRCSFTLRVPWWNVLLNALMPYLHFKYDSIILPTSDNDDASYPTCCAMRSWVVALFFLPIPS